MPLRNCSLQYLLRTLLLSALCTFGLTGARAATLIVPVQYPTIQAAVDAAVIGDTVLVYDGTYTGTSNHNIDFKGKDLTVKSSGGANLCIIDCQGTGRGFCLNTGQTAASRIEGFTIKSGNIDGSGGGVYIETNGTVANCILSANTASHHVSNGARSVDVGSGGGMSGGTAINCTFSGNISINGGGMSNGTAFNCTFNGNRYKGYSDDNTAGGAFKCTAINCLFLSNLGTHGSAMNTGTAINCTFTKNQSYGIFSPSTVPAIVGVTATNCIFWNNFPQNVNASNTIISSDVQGGAAGASNISFDPGFVNAASGDYHLLASSPCIDGGTTSGLTLPATDLDGNPRLLGRAPDMGAYESTVTSLAFTALYARNDTTGQNSFRQLFRNTLLRANTLPTVTDLHWKMATAADLFHQGNTDLLWRNDTTGDIVYWDVKDETIVSSGYLGTVADLNWQIVGSTDLFHAGNTDLIWYNKTTGDIVYWDLSGTTLVASGYIATLADKNWQIVAVVDLFHTGHTDLIWQHSKTGDIAYWDLNATTLAASGYIATLTDTNWKIVGASDLFHQNHTDLIWQHGSTGDVVYWDLAGATLTGSGYLFTLPDPQMKIHAVH